MSTMTHSDAELLRASLGGNQRAFASIVERYKSLVCCITYNATGDIEMSEDLAQETFVAAWAHLGQLREAGKLKSWICAIARNMTLRWQQKRGRDVMTGAQRLENSAAQPADGASPRQSAIGKERQALLWQAIQGMPANYRLPLLLFYREGKSVQRVAEILELAPNNVKQRLHRGRGMLRERVLSLVEDTLSETRPGKGFTLAVLAALPKVPAAAAAAAGAGASKPAVGWSAKLATAGATAQAKLVAAAALGVLLLGAGAAVHLGKDVPEASATAAVEANVPPSAAAIETPDREAQAALVADTQTLDTADLAEPSADAPKPPKASTEPPVEELATAGASAASPLAEHERKARELALPGYPGRPYPERLKDTVQGVVLDEGRQPLAGAKVWLCRFMAQAYACDVRETVSDAEGRFTLKAPRGQWCLGARKGFLGGEGNTGPGGLLSTEGNRRTYDADIRMERRGMVRGTIYDKNTGEPIPHGQLLFGGVTITADEQGRYELEGVSRGEQSWHMVRPICPEYSGKPAYFCTIKDEITQLNLFLSPGGTIRGRVVDPNGTPLAHAWVGVSRVLSDESGRYELPGMPIGKPYFLNVVMPFYDNKCGSKDILGRTYAVKKVLIPASETSVDDVVVTLDPLFLKEEFRKKFQPTVCTGGFAGRVVGPNGAPIRDFRVLVQHSFEEVDPSASIDGVYIGIHYDGFSVSSEDGTFHIASDGFEPGKAARIIATVDGYGEAAVDPATVLPLARLRNETPLVFRLRRASRLTVKVEKGGAGGSPIAGVHIRVCEVNRRIDNRFKWGDSLPYRYISQVTDERGEARFTEVPFAEGIVVAEGEGLGRVRRDWHSGQRRLSMAMSPEAFIEGTVLDDGGKPKPKASVRLTWAESDEGSGRRPEVNTLYEKVRPDDKGKFRFSQLPPAEYKVLIDLVDGSLEQSLPGKAFSKLNDSFSLAAGQAMTVTYPADSVQNNPGRFLARPAEAEEMALHKRLIGAWRFDYTFPENGSRTMCVEVFEDDGRWERWTYVPPFVQYIKGIPAPCNGCKRHDWGMFRIVDKTIEVVYDTDSTSAGGFSVPGLRFRTADEFTCAPGWKGAESVKTYRRVADLDRVLAEGEAMTAESVVPQRRVPREGSTGSVGSGGASTFQTTRY